MPWCPKCKAEYQEGFTECSDCKTELVDDIREAEILVPFFQADDKKIAQKLVKFFQYSDVNSSFEYDEETELYIVSVPPKKQMQAKKLYQAFYFVERERLMNGESDLLDMEETKQKMEGLDSVDNSDSQDFIKFDDNSDNVEDYAEDDYDNSLKTAGVSDDEDNYDQDTPSDEATAFDDEDDDESAVYIMKADQYKDLAGTVGVFLFFGVAGIIFVLLNVIGTLNFLNGLIPTTVMSVMFLAFLYIALSTNHKAKKVQAEIDAENKLTDKINEWLKQNVTESFLASIHNDTDSDELNYLKKIDTIKEKLLQEFGPQNLAYLDRLIEEYYIQTFEHE